MEELAWDPPLLPSDTQLAITLFVMEKNVILAFKSCKKNVILALDYLIFKNPSTLHMVW